MTTLFIKNMVCDRCKMAVKNELDKNQILYHQIELGEVELEVPLSYSQLSPFKAGIERLGFELIEDRGARVVSQIKKNIIEWIQGNESKNKKVRFSAYLADQLHKDYATLSNLFSSVEGTTIEQYLIHQKIEKVKELLVYHELTLNEIAERLSYSSPQHLSTQFKKITGLTPSHFRNVGAAKRVSIDKI